MFSPTAAVTVWPESLLKYVWLQSLLCVTEDDVQQAVKLLTHNFSEDWMQAEAVGLYYKCLDIFINRAKVFMIAVMMKLCTNNTL